MTVLPIFVFSFLFALGCIVGSFLNVVILRSPARERLGGRSHCDTCDMTLGWRELIPLISFVYQKGRCRHCGTVLSMQYPLVEFSTGVIFVSVGWQLLYQAIIMSNVLMLVDITLLLAASAAMIVVIVTDFKYQIIPNGAVLLLGIAGIITTILRNGVMCLSTRGLCAPFSALGIVQDFAASAGAVLFLFVLWYFSKGAAMGFGDVKLIGATSLLLGFPLSLVGFIFSFWIGGFWGLFLLLTRARNLKSQIAFGPFIIAGAVLAFLFGHGFLAASGFAYLL